MKHVIKQTIQIQCVDDRYGNRTSSIALSDEVFSPTDIVKITGIAQAAALKAGVDFEFAVASQTFDIYETEQEKQEAKEIADAEAAERAEKTRLHRQELVDKIVVLIEASEKPYVEAAEDALEEVVPGWEQHYVRDMLKEQRLYYPDR